jgi:hypothetical protein
MASRNWCITCGAPHFTPGLKCKGCHEKDKLNAIKTAPSPPEHPTPPFTYQVMDNTDRFGKVGIPTSVDVSDDGELVCMRCRLSNCQHIKAVLELNLDDKIIYIDTVTVPMDLNHNVFVKFVLGEAAYSSRSIRLHPDEGDPARKAGSLGFLTVGDTRKVLRSILLDWLKFYLIADHFAVVCSQKTHGYVEQQNLEKNMKARGIMPYLETWSSMRNNACMSCMEFVSGDDDLIPSAPKKGGSLPPRPGSARRAPAPRR